MLLKYLLTLFLFLFLFPSSFLYANELYTISSGEMSEIELIIVNSYMLTFFIGSILGILMFLMGIKKLLEHSKNPQSPQNSLGSVFVLMIGASLLFTIQSSISLGITSLTGSSGHCFIYNDSVTTDVNLKRHPSNCFDPSSSEVTKQLREKLESEGKTKAVEELNSKIKILFSVFQLLGLIYFVKGIFLLKAAAEGRSDTTYGKILIMIIVSTLVIDMPNTMDMLIETAKKMSAL